MEPVVHIIQKEIGKLPHEINALSGGDINEVYHCIFENQEIVIKLNIASAYPEMFEKEKKGLELLSTSTFRVPNPIAVGSFESKDYLILEYIPLGKVINWEIFGEKLAKLHQIANDQFGLDHDNYIGSIIQKNNYQKNWKEFYASQRILYLSAIARDKGLLNKSDCIELELLCSKINEIIPLTNPSLIHGDLWSGNLICSANNQPVLIDPAVYYGHPEMDWAMLSLFGSYPSVAFEVYCEKNNLEKGFEK